ncbi:MAG: fumarate hydratase [Candidatus Omnitrophota bacterium]|jgi:fumarate hydratase subunit alpha
MRIVSANKIRQVVSDLCVQANLVLRNDVLQQLKRAYLDEAKDAARDILEAMIKNAEIARLEKLAICQDTGMPCVFVEIGENVKISGDIKEAINKGIERGYKEAYLRNSVIADPLTRGTAWYSPAVIHFDFIKGSKIKLTVFPKGFGCENKTRLKMFNPTVPLEEIKRFIIAVVKSAGPDACPPYVVGVGIGGTADYACFLAKKALLRKVHGSKFTVHKLEKELFREINKLNIGPMGLGGKTTCLGVNIETFPTHIAGLPVAVNISCHALRSAGKTI